MSHVTVEVSTSILLKKKIIITIHCWDFLLKTNIEKFRRCTEILFSQFSLWQKLCVVLFYLCFRMLESKNRSWFIALIHLTMYCSHLYSWSQRSHFFPMNRAFVIHYRIKFYSRTYCIQYGFIGLVNIQGIARS